MLCLGSFAVCAISLCGVCRWTQQKGRGGALFSRPCGRRLKADEEGLAEKKAAASSLTSAAARRQIE